MEDSLLKFLKVPLRPGGKPVQWILAALFLLAPIWAQAQVSGRILDENSAPIAGVTVVIKGTTTGTITDIDGNYTLDANSDQVLVFTYVGYEAQEITVGAQSVIDAQLALDVTQLEELVVTGYSVERKRDLLGAVAVADMDAVKDVSQPSVLNQMQGRIPGVHISESGIPGEGSTVRIRGVSTLGNNAPLYIIDGVPTQPFQITGTGQGRSGTNLDLGWLNPADIESMQVLKDASSASIYGARASNGVIIITTKQPKKGKTSITVDARFSVDNVTDVPDFANGEQKATIQWQAAVNDGADPDAGGRYKYQWHFDPSLGRGIQDNGVPVLDQIIYPDWLDESDQLRPSGHPSSVWTGTEFGAPNQEAGTDWNDVIYQTGIVQNYNIGLSQAGDRGGVHLSLNYFDQKGVVIHTDFERFTIRLNSNYNFAGGKVTVGQNLGVSREEKQWSDRGFGGTTESLTYRMKPVLPVKTEDGRFSGPPGAGFDDRDNPAGLADDNQDDRIHNTKILGNVYLDWKIIEGLSFRTNLGIDYDNIFERDIYRTYSRGFLGNAQAELDIKQYHQTNWVWNNTLTYTKTINQHSFTVLAGTEAIENFFTFFTALGKEFALETADYFQLDAASGERTATGNSTGFSLFSIFGKANYSFQDKYLASFTIRRDGSSRFGRENLYGTFPAASVGWRIGAEDFMSGLGWLSELKIRAAYGQTGNQDILNEARFGLYAAVYAPPSVVLPWGGGCGQTTCNNAATSYDIGNQGGGNLPSGFLSQQTENNELKWETQSEINIGLDFGFIDDRLSGSFEYFQKTTEDILVQPSAVGTFGDGASRWANGADMETTGWELLLGYNSQAAGDWTYSVSVNGAHYDDVITALPEDLWATYPGNVEQNIIGQSPNAIFAYVTDGLLQTHEEAQSAPQYNGIRVGNFNYVDLNGDGVINSLDQEYQGVNNRPKLEYGINGQVGWKNFDLTLQFIGMTGRKTTGAGANFFELSGNGPARAVGAAGMDSWTFVNTGTHIPAASTLRPTFGPTDWQIRNGGFFNFRQATLGYTLPQSVIGNVSWLSNLRVYFSMENINYWYTREGPKAYKDVSWKIDGGVDDVRENAYASPLRTSLGLNMGF